MFNSCLPSLNLREKLDFELNSFSELENDWKAFTVRSQCTKNCFLSNTCLHETFTGGARTYESPKIQKLQFSHSTQLLEFPCTHHFLRREGIHPLLYQRLHVVLREVFALLLLFEADEAWRVALLPLHQLLLRVGRRALGPVPTQALLQVPTAQTRVWLSKMLEGWNSNWSEDKRSLAVSGNCSTSSDPSKHQRLKVWETLGPVYYLFIPVDCKHHFN